MTRFDLTKLGEQYVAKVARMRFFVGVFVAAALAGAAYLGIRDDFASSWTRPNLELLLGLAIIAIALGAVTWILSPNALAVDVDLDRVRFEYPGGRVKSLDWESPGFRLVVDHTSGRNDSISHGKPVQLAADRRVFQDFLSPAAFRAILDGADRHGLNVTERPSPRPGWTRTTITQVAG